MKSGLSTRDQPAVDTRAGRVAAPAAGAFPAIAAVVRAPDPARPGSASVTTAAAVRTNLGMDRTRRTAGPPVCPECTPGGGRGENDAGGRNDHLSRASGGR